MNDTLDELPGEGATETVVKTRMRHKYDVCGDPAHYKHTFLLEGARRNPASSAYGRDDCTWCEDESRFVCAEHKNERRAPDGYSWCITFPATERFAHMFLYWRETKQATVASAAFDAMMERDKWPEIIATPNADVTGLAPHRR